MIVLATKPTAWTLEGAQKQDLRRLRAIRRRLKNIRRDWTGIDPCVVRQADDCLTLLNDLETEIEEAMERATEQAHD